MTDVVLDHIEKVYDNGFHAVKDLSLEIADSEFLVLVGPSGCGKSTALRMVAGLEDITGGELRVGGRRMNEVAPRDRDIAMVFQSYALYPHLSVGENIGFGLKLRRMPKAEINTRVHKAAKMLGLDEILDRRPKQLSGGQRQRVAMGRAIVRAPQVFLMDEPLSNLDAKLRVQMRAEIARLQHDMNVTTIYVTHDQIEAMTMGDRVAVMSQGDLMQVGSPQTLYDDPDNLFVGSFIGSPPMNVVEATVADDGDGLSVIVGSQTLGVAHELVAERPALRTYVGKQVAMGVRSEDLSDGTQASDAPGERRLRTTVLLTEALGSEIVVHFGVDARKVTPDDLARGVEPAEDIFGIAPDVTPFVASFSPRSRVRAGDDIEVVADTSRLHFFDLETGLSIHS
jgi:multiple sugar transport system ATP-binding protein